MRSPQGTSATGTGSWTSGSWPLWSRELNSDTPGATPLTRNRKCTDVTCVLALFVALAGFGMLYAIGASAGKLKPYSALKDYTGSTCGEDGRGQFVYFCLSQRQLMLDISHQVCVDRCPSGSGDSVGAAICSQRPDFGGSSITYATTPLFNVICIPNGRPYAHQVLAAFGNNALAEEVMKLMEAFSHHEIMALAAVVSVLASFAFLALLRCFTQLLIWLCLFLIFIAPATLGCTLLLAATIPGGESAQQIPVFLSSGDPQADFVIGNILLVISIAALCVIVCLRRQVELAVRSVQEACTCILGMPGLILEPWLSLMGKVAVVIPGVLGFVSLLISGAGEHTLDFTQPSAFFSLDNIHVLMLLLYAILFIWVMELMHSISQFVVIYVAETWFFNGSGKSRFSCFVGYEMLAGYRDAITTNLGSLIYGSLVLTFFRLVRYAVEAGNRAAKNSNNSVMYLLCCLCRCCAGCLENLARYISKFAYMDVAMNSSNYCEAALQASYLIISSGLGLTILESTMWVFTFCGTGGSAAASGAVAWLLVTSLPKYSDPSSSTHIADAQSVVLAAAILGVLVALPILHILDTVADTMFYCNALGPKRNEVAAESERQTMLTEAQKREQDSDICTRCINATCPALGGPKQAAHF